MLIAEIHKYDRSSRSQKEKCSLFIIGSFLCPAAHPLLTPLIFAEQKNSFFWQFGAVPSTPQIHKCNRQILLYWLILFLLFLSLKMLLILSFSPALIVVFALGSLGLILALTVNRHKHPLNLYLLFGFVSILAVSVT